MRSAVGGTRIAQAVTSSDDAPVCLSSTFNLAYPIEMHRQTVDKKL
jgi:hypothetical protein